MHWLFKIAFSASSGAIGKLVFSKGSLLNGQPCISSISSRSMSSKFWISKTSSSSQSLTFLSQNMLLNFSLNPLKFPLSIKLTQKKQGRFAKLQFLNDQTPILPNCQFSNGFFCIPYFLILFPSLNNFRSKNSVY